ncbi:MAG: PPC domain-containing protein [Gemmatimonadota bacterium]
MHSNHTWVRSTAGRLSQSGVSVLAVAAVILAGMTLPPALSAQDSCQESCASFPELAVGSTVEGSLPAQGPEFAGRGPFQAYRFTGAAGIRYQVDLRSSDFDTHLTLARPVGGITETVREDDDGGEGTDSRMAFTVDAPGEYVLIVQSWSATGGGGSFSLELQERELPPARLAQEIARGELVSDYLSEESGVYLTEQDQELPFHLWTLDARGGEQLRISMDSDEFDAYLEFGPLSGGEIQVTDSDDDGGDERDALLVVTVSHDGRFGIRARGLSGDAAGNYTLRVDEFEPREVVRTPLSPGEVSAVLTLEDPRTERGSPFQEWVFQAESGVDAVVRMRSDGFDAYLHLGQLDGQGNFVELASNDDAEDDGTNARVDFRVPDTGEYVIRVSAFSSSGAGSYTLSLEFPGGD